jgi:hypothetical protein
MRARAANMDNRIVNLYGNMLVSNAFRALEFDVQVYGKRLIRVLQESFTKNETLSPG